MCSPRIIRRADPRRQGNAGLGIAIAFFTASGWNVSVPLTDSQAYDLVVDDGEGLKRVWVRTTTCLGTSGRYYLLNLRTVSGLGRGLGMGKVKPFDAAAVGLLFVACGDGSLFVIPSSTVAAKCQLQLGPKWAPFRVAWDGEHHADDFDWSG